MIHNLQRLAIGSAQFGMDYGIFNKSGITPEQEVAHILELAFKNGIHMIDTATSYGVSEEVIGRNIKDLQFKIVTKTPVFKKDRIEKTDANYLIESFHQSLRKLKQDTLYGLLIHYVNDLLVPGGELLWRAMESLKLSGLVKKIGVSVYSSKEIEKILEKYQPNLIQLPINVLDQQMLKDSYLTHIKRKGIEIHARSVFLQGLLLMSPDEIPEYFKKIKPLLVKYHEDIKLHNMNPISSAIGFVLKQLEIDYLIVGINNANQLKEIIEAVKNISPLDLDKFDYSKYAINDESIIKPILWRL